jgi:hypothetical protein
MYSRRYIVAFGLCIFSSIFCIHSTIQFIIIELFLQTSFSPASIVQFLLSFTLLRLRYDSVTSSLRNCPTVFLHPCSIAVYLYPPISKNSCTTVSYSRKNSRTFRARTHNEIPEGEVTMILSSLYFS